MEDLELVLHGVGPRLRALRQQRQVTLTQLATTTGISVSTLSRLESGQRKPTLELLWPLARAHELPLDELVSAPGTSDPRVRPRPFRRNGTTYFPLTRRPGELMAHKAVIPVNWPAQEPKLRTHDGFEWLYVLSGQLRIRLGERDLTIRAGEVAEFDTRTPHFLGNPGPGVTEILTLFGPHGERPQVKG